MADKIAIRICQSTLPKATQRSDSVVPTKATRKNLKVTAKPAALLATLKKAVTGMGAPS